jgi:spermidine/putrescine transport system substrate-binding protein
MLMAYPSLQLNMNRYTKLALFAGLAISLIGCSPKTPLYIYTWADYIDPELIQKFENENDCKVVIDTFDSNETMLAKLLAGGGGYDIITPTDYVMPHLISADLIERLDSEKLPLVVKNLDKSFAIEHALTYNVPYAFSCIGILWRKDKVPSDLTFEDWNDMFDSRLKGRVCMMNDIREVIGLGLKMKGYSVNSTSKAELDESVEVAKLWKSKSVKMDNEAYRTGIPSGEFYTAMAYNSDAVMLMVNDPETIGYALPTNGIIASMDVFCILKKSKSKELAYKFIDMFYNPTNAAKNAQFNCAPMPVLGMFDALEEEYKAVPFMKVTDEMRSKCEYIQDVGEALSLYSKAWDKIKSTR